MSVQSQIVLPCAVTSTRLLNCYCKHIIKMTVIVVVRDSTVH